MTEDKDLIAKLLIDELQQKEFLFTDDKGHPLVINVKGSLGLLAAGYQGLAALRNLRARENYKNPNAFVTAQTKKKEA
jgi:hypothetical protein